MLTGDCGAVAGFELLAIERDRTAGHLNIGVPVGPEFVLDDFARSEDGGIQFVVLADLHGTFAAVGRGQQAQLTPLFGFLEVLLVVDRLVALLVGEHPDLVEVHRFLVGSVELAMRHAGARAHVLHVARTNDRAVTHAVFVGEGALENISDDFHILVRMSREAGTARDAVVVHHAQGAELHVFRVKIVGEGKGEAGVKPAVVGMAAVAAFANGDHLKDLLGTVHIIVVITTIVKRRMCPARQKPYLLRTQYLRRQEGRRGGRRAFPPAFLWCTVVSLRPPSLF